MQLAYVSIAVLVATVQARYAKYHQTFQPYHTEPLGYPSSETMTYDGPGHYRQMSYTNQLTTNNADGHQVTPWDVHRSDPLRIPASSKWLPANHGYETVNAQVVSNPGYYGNQYSPGPETNNQGYGINSYSSSSGTNTQSYHSNAAMNNQGYQGIGYNANSASNNRHYSGNTAMNQHGYYDNSETGLDMSYLPLLLDGEELNALEMSMLVDPESSQNMLPYYLMENGPENILPMLALSGGQADQGIQQYMMMAIDEELF